MYSPRATFQAVQRDVPGYPFVDAMIAAAVQASQLNGEPGDTTTKTMRLETMVDAFKCLMTDEEREEALVDTIPDIIENAQSNAVEQVGRVLETVDQTVVVGENYKATIKGVSFPCTVLKALSLDGSGPPAAYG